MKESTLKFNKNVHRFSEELLAEVKEICKDYIYYFDYTDNSDDSQNPFAFFKYSTPHQRPLGEFRNLNSKMMDWVTNESLENINYVCNDPALLLSP